ncbi:MAG: AbrB/MazE/SpoVT family DNA-binding domain-containing protein [Candidatus Eremiobacteraeota bacterium]|nr:AbrB/MazE/SpoVT family DNA-binding domain-containing protein [Candidatus Eremiobacteraeota bacterium]MCW5869483.1 AbrB/MazE/SpoVT family DNA-binding domain-containing protein [Candidatus Eremiobacteraeota bacterium]
MKAVVSEKGQVTIPKALRQRLAIQPGQILEFVEENGRLVATKAVASSPFQSLYGILPLDQSVDEVVGEMRDSG